MWDSNQARINACQNSEMDFQIVNFRDMFFTVVPKIADYDELHFYEEYLHQEGYLHQEVYDTLNNKTFQ